MGLLEDKTLAVGATKRTNWTNPKVPLSRSRICASRQLHCFTAPVREPDPGSLLLAFALSRLLQPTDLHLQYAPPDLVKHRGRAFWYLG